MKPQEYVTMHTVEDWHWWYTGLRNMLKHHWNIYVSSEKLLLADVGCGTGGNMAFLETQGRGYGLDRSREAIAFCRQRGLTKTTVASADQIPYPNETFEAVLSLDVLSHRWVQNKQDALNEMARILKPGGYLFLNLAAYQWLHSSHDVAVEQDWRATASQVRQMLTVSGLEIDRVTYWNTLLFPAFALLRLMRKRKRGNASSSDLRRTKKPALASYAQRFYASNGTSCAASTSRLVCPSSPWRISHCTSDGCRFRERKHFHAASNWSLY